MTKKIPRFSFSFSKEDIGDIIKTFFSNNAIQGDDIARFERRFAQYIGTEFAVSVPSARIGLYFILKNLNFNRGDEIILPAYTYYAMASVIISLGLKPVFVDVNPFDCTIDISLVEKNITHRTKAIIPTHLYGQPCEMDTILQIAGKNNIKIIEDCAKACGAEYKGRKVGSIGDYAYFTFGLTKELNALGGGMITTNDRVIAAKIREETSKYRFTGSLGLVKMLISAFVTNAATNKYFFGFFIYPLIKLLNKFGIDPIQKFFDEKEKTFSEVDISRYRLMSNLQAKIGLRSLSRLDGLNEQYLANAGFLHGRIKNNSNVKMPVSVGVRKRTCLTYILQTDKRGELASELLKAGVDTSRGYMKNCASLEIFKEFNTECPNAEAISRRILHLPIYPSLDESDFVKIAGVLEKFYESQKYI